MTYRFRRVQYQSGEWHWLLEEGWRTVTVSEEGIALMRKRREPAYPDFGE